MDIADDPLLDEITAYVIKTKSVSISSLQRKFRIGYYRTTRLINGIYLTGIVDFQDAKGNWNVCSRISDIEYQCRIDAVSDKKIVIWLDQTKSRDMFGDPVYVVRSFSPFEFLANQQLIDESFKSESNADILNGYKFSATMQFRTPVDILKQHGRIEKKTAEFLPKIISEHWQGIWIPNVKRWRDIGIDIDEMRAGTMSSEIGQISSDGGDFLRFMLFVNQIFSENISYEDKIRWIRIGYSMIGQDGEPFCKFMDHYGNNIDQITSRLFALIDS
ncbi:DNA translocase FtsK [Limnobaculum xujianqingii]|uniref:DNA translocase FtsK n=1 Tax=Limnobaculum xujianqingii TaxID=2738837 RepID=UPI00112922D6|nr:DNA translocase FtsK [Limnobaculum xujianqingii]